MLSDKKWRTTYNMGRYQPESLEVAYYWRKSGLFDSKIDALKEPCLSENFKHTASGSRLLVVCSSIVNTLVRHRKHNQIFLHIQSTYPNEEAEERDLCIGNDCSWNVSW